LRVPMSRNQPPFLVCSRPEVSTCVLYPSSSKHGCVAFMLIHDPCAKNWKKLEGIINETAIRVSESGAGGEIPWANREGGLLLGGGGPRNDKRQKVVLLLDGGEQGRRVRDRSARSHLLASITFGLQTGITRGGEEMGDISLLIDERYRWRRQV